MKMWISLSGLPSEHQSCFWAASSTQRTGIQKEVSSDSDKTHVGNLTRCSPPRASSEGAREAPETDCPARPALFWPSCPRSPSMLEAVAMPGSCHAFGGRV